MNIVVSTELVKQFIAFIEKNGTVSAQPEMVKHETVEAVAKQETILEEKAVKTPKKSPKGKKETSSAPVAVDSASVSSTEAEDVFSDDDATGMFDEPVEEAVTKDQIIELLTKFNAKNGPVETRKILINSGVQKVSELKPEQYSKFYKAVEARLGA